MLSENQDSITNTSTCSLAGLIWSVADLLRSDFKQSQYGRIILPFTVLRHLECVLADSKDKVAWQIPAWLLQLLRQQLSSEL